MASLGGEQIISTKDLTDSTTSQKEIRPSSVEKKSFMEDSNSTIHWFAQIGDDENSSQAIVRDRDEKLRLAKERQNEERQRKIEELRAQAEAAQKYREQKEEERKRKIEELRHKDNDRRQQVEERKKAIMEAEKERREYILRKNQVNAVKNEREARLDTKKRNERSSIAFAFGSSTPRLLDPAELGNVSPSTYWGHRRSTSITNVAYTGAALTRRSSERDLVDGSKKRATSAGGIDRQNDEETTTDSPPISYRSVARRKTDLMPTIPSPRESSFGSKTSLHSHTPRTPGSRSGDVTPGGSINTSRPGSAMSTSTTASGLVQRRSIPPARKPRPASIAVTGVSLNDELNKQKKDKPPLPKLQSTPKRVSLSNSNSISKVSSLDSIKHERRSSAKKDPQTPKLRQENKPATAKQITFDKTEQVNVPELVSVVDNQNPQTKEEKEAINAEKTENTSLTNNENVAVNENKNGVIQQVIQKEIETLTEEKISSEEKLDNDTEKEMVSFKGTVAPKEQSIPKEITPVPVVPQPVPQEIRELSVERQDNEMTASMIARKITTEEQAKAALAERRRIAREEAERQAEIERQRLEAEREVELKRIAEEEERQRKFEEETLRLAKEQRKAEEERLLQAIEEAKKREEADKLKREEEEKLKAEREEADKKAKEEAEKQRLEVAERLKREEKEREERRKRVEAIMSRTRAKGGGGNATPNSTPTKDNDKSEEKSDKSLEEDKTANIQQLDNNSEINENVKIEENLQHVVGVAEINEQHQPQESLQQQPEIDQHSYEKSVTEKENALMKTFSNMMIVDENTKNYQNFQNPLVEVTNGKPLPHIQQSNEIVSHSIANGNGHIETLNKNDTNTLVDISSSFTDQLIEFSNESQQIADAVNCNNNNSLLTSSTTTTTLVTSDSHENKEISLL